MIVEWAKTSMELVEHGFGTSPLMREKTLGVVLNKADIDRMRRYEIYRGRSYYNEYYQRYGYTD
jgi:polysaccharide biosynthesis transport protein